MKTHDGQTHCGRAAEVLEVEQERHTRRILYSCKVCSHTGWYEAITSGQPIFRLAYAYLADVYWADRAGAR